MTIKTTLTIAAAAMFAFSAQAGPTIDMKFMQKGQGHNVKLTFNGKTSNVFAGQLLHQFSNPSPGAEFLDGLTELTYCTDLHEYTSSSSKSYELVDLNQAPVTRGVSVMSNDQASAILDLYNAMGNAHLRSDTSNEMAAAFQLAVWEIVYDFDPTRGASSLDLTTGNVQAKRTNGTALKSSFMTTYNDLIDNIGRVCGGTNLFVVARDGNQDQLVNVPAPASIGLAGIGLLAVSRRRR